MTQPPFVIVGASLAGASAAQELRKQGFDGRIVLLGAEQHYPYSRPALSKGLLNGSEVLGSVWIEPESWYADNGVEVRTGTTVEQLLPGDHTVVLAGGEALPYEKLLLATGARPRTLGLPGFDHPAIRYLRTIDDALMLKAMLSGGGKRLVIVGSGWIGLELAAVARQLGNEVTVLDRNRIPLAAVLGERLGAVFAGMHLRHGVQIVPSVEVQELMSVGGGITGVRYDGLVLPADIVVVGVGAQPNVELAQEAGLRVDNGVLVDEYFHTSAADITAAGDVANVWHRAIGQRIRSEHWRNAIKTGEAAARSMLGIREPYAEVPYFYTDQFEISMEYSGYGVLASDADLVIRGDVEALKFIAFWVREGRVVAGMNVNVWEVNEEVQRLIRERLPVDSAELRDARVPLNELFQHGESSRWRT